MVSAQLEEFLKIRVGFHFANRWKLVAHDSGETAMSLVHGGLGYHLVHSGQDAQERFDLKLELGNQRAELSLPHGKETDRIDSEKKLADFVRAFGDLLETRNPEGSMALQKAMAAMLDGLRAAAELGGQQAKGDLARTQLVAQYWLDSRGQHGLDKLASIRKFMGEYRAAPGNGQDPARLIEANLHPFVQPTEVRLFPKAAGEAPALEETLSGLAGTGIDAKDTLEPAGNPAQSLSLAPASTTTPVKPAGSGRLRSNSSPSASVRPGNDNKPASVSLAKPSRAKGRTDDAAAARALKPLTQSEANARES